MKNPHRILLLSSGSFLASHPDVFEKPFRNMRMVYIPTASKGTGSTEYIERRRKLFKAENYNYTELDLDGKSEQDIREALTGAEVVYVEGGNTFYLLRAVRESGFDKVLPEFLDAGLIYVGSSAGSYIACPTIEMATWKHPGKYDCYGMTDFRAMGLVSILISVHYKDEYRELLKEKFQDAKFPVRILTDEQALLVKGDDVQLIGEGSEVIL